MAEYIVLDPERTEEGGFIVTLSSAEGEKLAQGEGATYEQALEDAESKL